MRFVYYGIALLATVLAGLLWVFIIGQLRAAPGSPGAAAAAPAVVGFSSGRLPVVPVLPVAGGYGPGDPLYDAQVEAFREGRLVCVAGSLARPVSSDGVVSYVAIETDRGRLPCP